MRQAFITAILSLLALLPLSAASLDDAFGAADADSQQLIPLLETVSATLPTLPYEDALALADRVAPYCRQLFKTNSVSRRERFGLVTHVVAAGENPSVIARRYKCSPSLLAQLNTGYDPRSLAVGQELTVLDLATVPIEIIVSRAAYRMMIWRGQHLLAVFRCGLGRDSSPTPIGSTTIKMCVRNPEWRDPDTGKIYKPSDPGNVLGGYWIGFEPGANDHFKGIGIHGFTAESPEMWLEKNGSHGCVRLTQTDISWAFTLIRPGIRVTIRE